MAHYRWMDGSMAVWHTIGGWMASPRTLTCSWVTHRVLVLEEKWGQFWEKVSHKKPLFTSITEKHKILGNIVFLQLVNCLNYKT